MPNSETNSSPKSGELRLTTFGEVSLRRVGAEEGAPPLLSQGKLLAMLVYLTCSPQRTASREHVLNLLWADIEPAAARHALRQALWYLRRQVGADVVTTRDRDLVLTASLRSDREDFLVAVDRSELERAMDEYRGEFLAGLAVPGGAEFEQWIDIERSRLGRIFACAAESLVRNWLSCGRAGDAVRLARRVREMTPGSQSAWRLLLESLLSVGDRLTGGAEANAFEDLLNSEGREPDPASRKLIDTIRNPPDEVHSSDNGFEVDNKCHLWAELVGRETEFSTIVEAWHRAKAGSGTHISITATAGLGKTRLLDDVRNRFRTMGVRVVQLRANPGEQRIFYTFAAALAGKLGELPGAVAVAPQCASSLVGLNPSLSSRFDAPPDAIREHDVMRRRTIALTELLVTVAHEEPIALLVDDLHWIDDASLDLLGSLSGSVDDIPALIVTATRPVPQASIRETASIRLTLPPLTEEQIGSLVSGMGSLPDDAWSYELPAQLLHATGGSPLLVLETLQLTLDHGCLDLSEQGWTCKDEDVLAAELEAGSALRRRVSDLSRSEGWILLLLAVSGSPLPLHRLTAMAALPDTSLSEVLSGLEQRGFVRRFDDEWETAHDEIATVARELATDEALTAANGAVGRVLTESAWDDLHTLTRAGQFFARAGNNVRLGQLFKRCVWLARQRGDGRRLRDLAAELLATDAGTREVTHLVRRLPLPMRLGLTSPRRIAAVTAVCVAACVAVTWAMLRPATRPPDAVLLASQVSSNRTNVVYEVSIYGDEWDQNEPLSLNRDGTAVPILQLDGQVQAVAPRPDGKAWAVVRLSPDSGGFDLFQVEEDGQSRRLTFAPRDDVQPSWSPDGRQVVFQTCRWDHLCRYDLAVLDVVSGNVRPLIRGDTTYREPCWSPGGERIAFTAGVHAGFGSEVCWITVDGTIKRCVTAEAQYASFASVSWRGPDQLMVTTVNQDEYQLALLDLTTESFAVVNTPHSMKPHRASVSPDGRWVAVRGASRTEPSEDASVVFPFERPELARSLSFPGSATGYALNFFAPPGTSQTFVDRIVITKTELVVPENAPYRPRLVGLDSEGNASLLPVVSWTIGDTNIASIDDLGTIHPRRAGAVRVTASAGGWRSDSVLFSIGTATHETVLLEDWSDRTMVGWRVFGDPSPSLTIGPDDTGAFWNRGDASFQNGAYTQSEFDAANGLGIELLLSAPITLDRWQNLEVALTPRMDTVALNRWDHKTGAIPSQWMDGSCGFILTPGTEAGLDTSRDATALMLTGGQGIGPVRLAGELRSGAWHRFRLQLFPDGACRVAVNGVPVAQHDRSGSLDRPLWLILAGRSFENRMLHGPLEVWTGVKGDIDWRVLGNRQ